MKKGKPFIVKNPVVEEILTEKWMEKIQNYQDFVEMMNALTDDVKELQALRKLTTLVSGTIKFLC